MALEPITAALDLGGKLIERMWPDPQQRALAQLELLRLQQSGELESLVTEFKDRDSAREREIGIPK